MLADVIRSNRFLGSWAPTRLLQARTFVRRLLLLYGLLLMYRFLMGSNLSAWRFSTVAPGRTTLAGGSGCFGAPLPGGSLFGTG
jgi:hypothetical protein